MLRRTALVGFIFVSATALVGFIRLSATQSVVSTPSDARAINRELWVATYDGPRHGNDAPITIEVSPDARTVFVAGTTSGRSRSCPEFAIVAYDAATGTEIWSSRSGSPAHSCDWLVDMAVSSDAAHVFVTGRRWNGLDYDIITAAYDARDGSELWVATQDGPGHWDDDAIGVISIGDTVYVAGSLLVDHSTDAYIFDAATIAYDAISGSRRWIAQYHVIGSTTVAMVVAGSGNSIYVGGLSPLNGRTGSFTVAYEASTGSQRWVASVPGIYGWGAIAESSDGETVFVAGKSPFDTHYRTLAYSATDGSRLWITPPRQPALSNLVDLVASPSLNDVYMAGTTTRHRDHFLVVALEAASGLSAWRTVYDNPKGLYDRPAALAVSGDGTQVFVSGVTQERSHHFRSVTVAYDAMTGQRRWSAVFGRQLGWNGSATAIATSPDGNGVYVAGEIATDTRSSDFYTIKYATTDQRREDIYQGRYAIVRKFA